MVHLCIAKELLDTHPDIKDKPAFLLGSVAPDAVHHRNGFSGDDKRKSHLCVGSEKWGEIVNNDEWMDYVLTFFNKYKNSNTGFDFLLGYISHILADKSGNIKIWTPFRKINMDNIKKLPNLWGSDYHKEAHEIDTRLFQRIRDNSLIWDNFGKSKGIDFLDMVSAEELNKMITGIPRQYTDLEPDSSFVFRFITPDIMDKFINDTAAEINGLLF